MLSTPYCMSTHKFCNVVSSNLATICNHEVTINYLKTKDYKLHPCHKLTESVIALKQCSIFNYIMAPPYEVIKVD